MGGPLLIPRAALPLLVFGLTGGDISSGMQPHARQAPFKRRDFGPSLHCKIPRRLSLLFRLGTSSSPCRTVVKNRLKVISSRQADGAYFVSTAKTGSNGASG